MRTQLPAVFLVSSLFVSAQVDTTKSKIPFEGLDQCWYNGGDRRTSAPVLENKYVTMSAMLDVNYTYSWANPIDNTVVGSTALARYNEVQLALGVIGGEFNYKNARGPGGVTSPTGYTTTAFGPGTPYPNWAPDLAHLGDRVIFAMLFRI